MALPRALRVHPDGLYYGPPYPRDDETLVRLENQGALGHSSVLRDDYRYFLHFPEEEDEAANRLLVEYCC